MSEVITGNVGVLGIKTGSTVFEPTPCYAPLHMHMRLSKWVKDRGKECQQKSETEEDAVSGQVGK